MSLISEQNRPLVAAIMVAAIGTLLLGGGAAAQVGPAPPSPPIPAPSDLAAEKSTDRSTDQADSAKEKKAGDAKDTSAKSDAKAADKTGEEKAAEKKEEAKKNDPVKVAIQKLRSWSLPEFIRWLQLHGISIVIILVVMSAILWIANRLHRRVVRLLASYSGRGSPVEQENRARTLVGVLHNSLRTAVIAVGCLTILDEVGVPVGPLLGSVAVVGVAVAFGAQSLVKDYFTGFLVLLEQQYIIGDVVRISGNNFSGLTGQVEQITLRVTILRDTEGAAHFIPHGQMTVVSNLTHGWSQAVFDLNVASEEHLDRVKQEFFALARGLREDSKFGPMILNDPEMLGLDSLGDKSFSVKFTLKTLPLMRWEVKREMLRRIKQRFDELKIKVTVPA
ncbi:MAG TPA: mechanosensitive ion channel domain-containing protein [Pirellulaceae bacterium]|jgi:small conductance mechanosensitive channel